jgi:beta-glucosidase
VIADLLWGDVNPSGKLPLTFPNKENEVGFTQSQYPGLPASDPLDANYTEKLEVGYRWYDAHGVTPAFPFGHGISYAVFQYAGLVVTGRTVSFTVANVGFYDGAEVVQLYIAFPAASGEPPQALKGFKKVMLTAGGAAAPVSFTLSDQDLSIWDVTAHAWAQQHGTFGVYVGSSSRDVRLKGTLTN